MVFWFFGKKEDKVDEKLKNSFVNIRKDIENISEWIDHFKGKHHKHENNFEHILKRLEYLEDLLLGHIKEGQEGVKSDKILERVQSFNRSNQSFMNVQSDDWKNVENPLDRVKNLTPAQKRILLLMMGSGGPLGYEEIAKKLKLSIVTARRHVNDILRSGVALKQKMSVSNRRKMFQIDQDLRVMLEDRGRKRVVIRRKK